jgi:4-amino-4-deoxy-L-arabinose transferase-like glycosyltransferase
MLFLAFGFLTKGPIIVALITLILLPWILIEKKISYLNNFPWKSGILMFF